MIIDRIRVFLVQQFFRDETVDALAVDQSLVSSGLLDSVATLKLVLFLEKEFDITIDSADIIDGELDSLKSLEALVVRKASARSA